MSTVNKYFLPHRATTDVMKDPSKSSIVLRKGELFVEAPSTGVGTGHSKIKIGDGKTPYSSLPYALGDTDTEVTNAIVTFTSNTGTSAKDVINSVKSGQSLATQIAGLKQAITLLANTPFTNRAFSTISDGNTQSVSATGTGDTLKVTAGSNVTLTFNNNNKSINIAAKDTTYVNATSSASGLMSAADKAKIDAISSGANKTAVTQKLSSGTNIGSVTIDGKTTELFAPTNTHYEAKNIVANSSTSTSDTTTALGNGSVNLNLVEDGKVRSSHTIKGSGATTVTTDTSGNIVINSIDNNTTYGQATDAKAGISKLYGTYGKNTDGSVTQDFITSELNNKLPIDGIAAKANQDSLGNNLSNYIDDAAVNGQTVTFIRGNGSTFSIHTQDNDTKYDDFVGATTAKNGGHGLVPAPTTSQTGYYLRGDGTWRYPSDVKVDNASNADRASTATVDSAGQNINTTYVKGVTGSNANVTVTKGNGATSTFTVNNVANAGTASYARSASTATADSAGQNINATYVKSVTGAGATVTITKGNGATAGFIVDGVASAATATADSAGQIINTTYVKGVTGSNATVTVTKGDGSTAAFTVNNVSNASTANYAKAASTATVDSAGQAINTTYIKNLAVSGRTITFTKGNGATAAITTQDTNTTYDAFKGATSSANGGNGLVPAPTTAQTGMYLKGDGTWANISGVITGTKVNNASTADYASSASNSTKATNDSAGQNINTTYIKSLSVSGRTITFTKGNGATGTITTQDTNTTYDAFKGATSSANGGSGLVPGPTSAQVGMYLRGDGTWHSPNDVKVNNASHADSADNASNATNASTAAYAKTASNADNATNAATATYAKTAGSANAVAWGNVSGKPSTYTPSAHTHTSIESVQLTNQDLNDYKSNSVQFLYGGGGNTVANKPSGVDAFGVYTYRSAQGFYTQELVDTNGTKYLRFCNSTSWTAWKTIVDSSNVAGYKVNNAGYADSAGKATNDSAGQNINTTYIKNLAVSGKTITYTKGNGATGTITTQDTNTTYNAGTGLSLSGTTFSINAGASTVAHASSADSSTNDSAGNNINNTYIKNLSVNGRTITFTKGNGSTTAITTQDTNTTYDVFKGATSSANGGNGLVPAPTTAQKDMYLKGDGTWANISGVIVGTKVTSAANADSADKATNDSAGQNINTTYIKSLSVSGRTITYTKGNGATGSFQTQDTDTNTTYSAGTGLALSGTTFSINAGASTVAYATNAGNGISNITRSGTTFTVTRQNGSTFSFNQQDSNTTYNNFAGATSTAAGGSGLVPAPAKAQDGLYLRGDGTWHSPSDVKANNAGYADSAGKTTNDSAGQNINTTYIKSLSVSGRTITYTKGNGATGTITTQDTNTTYNAGTGLSLNGTTFSINAGASTVAYATNAGNGISNITRSGTTFTVTRQNGSTFSFNQQDSNTTYNNFKGATTATAGGNGLVPAPTTAQVGFYLRGDGTWHSPSDVKANNAGYSDSAGKATNDSAGNNINTTYIKSLSVNGRVITYTKGNGTTGSITTQDTDTNTTYSAGTGLTLSGTTFSINAGASTVAYATNAGNSGKATNDSAGNNINSTYVKSVTYSGHTVTITKGNGSTTSFNTADNNTTYSALKNPNAITISLNGASQGAYDGSAAKSINITAASVGAAASSHSHSEYIKRSGDTMSGALNFANNIANAVGDDVYIGDFNKGGHLGILGKSNNTGITLIKAAGSWSTATSSASIDYDATNGCISFVFA